MKTITLSALVALALVLTVASFPGSSWIFRNDVELLTPSDHKESRSEFNWANVSVFPARLFVADTFTGDSREEEYIRAALSHGDVQLELIRSYIERHPSDPLGYASFVRMTCTSGLGSPDQKPSDRRAFLSRSGAKFRAAVVACRKGEALEPTNAYFPIMRAVFSSELGDLAEMNAALRSAGAKPSYDSHISGQIDTMEKALIKSKGYRGEFARMTIEASVLLPDFAHVKGFSRYLNDHGTLTQKRDLIQALYQMGMHEDAGIGILVAYAAVRILISDPIGYGKSPHAKMLDDELTKRAGAFDQQLSAANIAPTVPATASIYKTLGDFTTAFGKYIQAADSIFPGTETEQPPYKRIVITALAPVGALAALLSSLVFGGFALLGVRIQSESFRKMAPHLVCLPIVLVAVLGLRPDPFPWIAPIFAVIQLMFGFQRLARVPAVVLSGAATGFAVLFMLAAPTAMPTVGGLGIVLLGLTTLAWLNNLERRDKIASLAGPIIAGVAPLLLDPSTILASVGYFLVLALLAKSKDGEAKKVSIWFTSAFYVLLCLFSGFAVLWVGVIAETMSVAFVCLASLGAVAMIVFACKPQVTTRAPLSTALLLSGFLYLALSGFQLNENRRLSTRGSDFMSEATQVRKIAGGLK